MTKTLDIKQFTLSERFKNYAQGYNEEMSKANKDERILELENSLRQIIFELDTMPLFPGLKERPFGITHSLKIAQDALKIRI